MGHRLGEFPISCTDDTSLPVAWVSVHRPATCRACWLWYPIRQGLQSGDKGAIPWHPPTRGKALAMVASKGWCCSRRDGPTDDVFAGASMHVNFRPGRMAIAGANAVSLAGPLRWWSNTCPEPGKPTALHASESRLSDHCLNPRW